MTERKAVREYLILGCSAGRLLTCSTDERVAVRVQLPLR